MLAFVLARGAAAYHYLGRLTSVEVPRLARGGVIPHVCYPATCFGQRLGKRVEGEGKVADGAHPHSAAIEVQTSRSNKTKLFWASSPAWAKK